MTHAALAPLIGPEFDKFLCASIGEDRNGTMLSVLSALARLDVDPWQEAADLAPGLSHLAEHGSGEGVGPSGPFSFSPD